MIFFKSDSVQSWSGIGVRGLISIAVIAFSVAVNAHGRHDSVGSGRDVFRHPFQRQRADRF